MRPRSDVRGVANALWVFHFGIERATFALGAATENGIDENSGRNSFDNTETFAVRLGPVRDSIAVVRSLA